MPGNNSTRWAAMRSSSGRKIVVAARGHPDEPVTLLGTLTRANLSSPVSGSRTTIAMFRLSPEM